MFYLMNGRSLHYSFLLRMPLEMQALRQKVRGLNIVCGRAKFVPGTIRGSVSESIVRQ